jgi:hypothetical protein
VSALGERPFRPFQNTSRLFAGRGSARNDGTMAIVRFLPALGCAGALSVGALGCGGPDVDAMCEKIEDCRGGNDKDVKACVVDLEYVEDASDEIGCSSEFDDYFECVESHATCKDKSWSVQSASVCEAENNAYQRCSNQGQLDTH